MRNEFEPRRLGALAWFAISCGVIFIFQAFLPNYGLRGFLREWVSLSVDNVFDFKVWTVASYAFLHGGPFHVLFNLAIIFFLGRRIQAQVGERKTLQTLTLGVIGGAVVFVCLNLILDRASLPVVGASAGAMAIIVVVCLLNYNRQVELLLFFMLPLQVKVKWVLWGMVGFDAFMLLAQEIPGKGGPIAMAHSAHLGGALAGFLFFRYVIAGNPSDPVAQFFERFKSKKSEPRVEVVKGKREPRFSYKPSHQTVNLGNRNDVQKEVDRILDKINTQGFGSLSASEKATLERARDLLSK